MGSLSDWMDEQGEQPKPGTVGEWFHTRPDVLAEVEAGRDAGYKFRQIEAWLVEEHGFPFKSKSLSSWLNR